MTKKKLLMFLSLASLNLPAATHKQVELSKEAQKFVGTYCLDCHNEEKSKGDLRLDNFEFTLDNPNSAQNWQDILDVLNLGEMPPKSKRKPVPQPSKDEMTYMLEHLTNKLLEARNAMADTGGRLVTRRLNQREYVKVVGALLGVDANKSLLPDDDHFEGFDTVGSSLSLTGFHVDRYLKVAKDALAKLKPAEVGEAAKRKEYKHKTSSKKIKEAYEKYKNLYESGEVKHPGLVKEEYRRISPTQRRTYKQYYLENKNLYENFEGFDEGWVVVSPKTGNSVSAKMTGKPAGKYILRARVAAVGNNQEKGRYLGWQRRSVSDNPLNETFSYTHITGTMENPQIIEIPFETHGYKTTFYTRCRQTEKPKTAEFEDYMKPFVKSKKINWYEEGIWIDWIEVVGPDRPKNRFEEIFYDGVEPTPNVADKYAENILKRFAENAFRGKAPEQSFIDGAMKFYHMAKKHSRSFEGSVKEAMAYLMVSPRFLYAVEEGAEKISALSSRELANRLALFLWSSLPDDELITAAENKSLLKDDILVAQMERMLKDPKAEIFYHDYMDQWLGLHEIESVAFPDDFKREVLDSVKREPIETYKHLVKENLSVINLIKSDFVVVNAMLAEFYGIEGVNGNEYRAVRVSSDSVRGGLLGQAAILGMGGDGEKSLPIKRGAFVAAKIIDRHPPSPPPNVPLIKVDGRQSTRKLFEAHTDKAACASCHQRFDSFGFALEKFDELGRWRENETLRWKTVVNPDKSEKMVKLKKPVEVPIETHGILEDGKTTFSDYKEMLSLMASLKGDQFTGGMVKAFIKYGIGRPVSFTDKEMIDNIIRESAANDYKAKDLIKSFVLSRAFRTK